MIKEVEVSEIFKGIFKEVIKDVVKEVKFNFGCLNVFNYINLLLYLILVNWCQDLIYVNLGYFRYLSIFVNSFLFEGELFLGIIGNKLRSVFDKEIVFQDLVRNRFLDSFDGILVFVGDLVGDILVLLKLDVGIVIGKSYILRKVVKLFGIKFLFL